MKAWVVSDQYDEYATVVFAETRNKAKYLAMSTDTCEDMEYIHIYPYRFKDADSLYSGQTELDWNDPKSRRFLCEHGWGCVEPEGKECAKCNCTDVCNRFIENIE